jgi:hypothetical protein
MKARVEGVHGRAVFLDKIERLESHPSDPDERGEIG